MSSGSFLRKSDSTRQQRFLCKLCSKTFSVATLVPCYRQRKRNLNPTIYQYLVSGVSIRRLALLLNVDRKTVVRKFIFLGLQAFYHLSADQRNYPLSTEIEFDDLETFEHSKLKPLSVVVAVESHSRRILGFRVGQMAAKGLLVKKSLKKYGKREDQRAICREHLFEELRSYVHPNAVVKSDQNPHYTNPVKKHFPRCTHKVFKGRRGCVVGQGELKAGGYDPIFSINHTFAMKRANMNRLFRRTWNTTKKIESLYMHLAMYALFHNCFLIRKKSRKLRPIIL